MISTLFPIEILDIVIVMLGLLKLRLQSHKAESSYERELAEVFGAGDRISKIIQNLQKTTYNINSCFVFFNLLLLF